MTELSKSEFIRQITDLTHLYLLEVEDGKPYLIADIEYGGEEQRIRIELINKFDLDPYLPFEEACIDSRSWYVGGISFIEWDSDEEAEAEVFDEFFILASDAVYVSCTDDELSDIVTRFPNACVYLDVGN